MISLVVEVGDGRSVEVASVGREGAIGGDAPYLTFDRDGREQRLAARFVVAATDSTGRRATPSPPPPR